MVSNPDRAFLRYLLEGGFRVGYAAEWLLRPAAGNLSTARLHPGVINAYISDEVRKGRKLGPFSPGEISNLHVNRIGVVPKGHMARRFRLITDLSFPDRASVNNGIPPELCSLKYTSVEEVASIA